MSFLKKLFGQKSSQNVVPSPGFNSAPPSGVNIEKSAATPSTAIPTAATPSASPIVGAEQLLETLETSSSAFQKAAARKDLIAMGGAAVAPMLAFILKTAVENDVGSRNG